MPAAAYTLNQFPPAPEGSKQDMCRFGAIQAGADPENELGGGQFRGSPAGSRGGGPQKLTTFRS